MGRKSQEILNTLKFHTSLPLNRLFRPNYTTQAAIPINTLWPYAHAGNFIAQRTRRGVPAHNHHRAGVLVPDCNEVTSYIDLHGAWVGSVRRGHAWGGDRTRRIEGKDGDGVVVRAEGFISTVRDSDIVALLSGLASGQVYKSQLLTR